MMYNLNNILLILDWSRWRWG